MNIEAKLRSELSECHEIIRQLREFMTPTVVLPRHLGIHGFEQRLVLLLLARAPAVLTFKWLHAALYSDRLDGGPHESVLKVFLCRARHKLTPHAIIIETHWGVGYSMPRDSAERLHAMMGDGVKAVGA